MEKQFNWNTEKNQQLIRDRNVPFEDVVFYIQRGLLLDDLVHPNRAKYPDQRVFVVEIDNYVFLVPYVETESEIFLKTIIPSRKATKRYLGDRP